MPVRVLLAAGMMALAAAGCASQGTVASPTGPGASGVTGAAALGSASGSGPASASSTDSGSASASDQGSSTASASDTDSQADTDATSSPSTNVPVHKWSDVVTEGGFKIKINAVQVPWNPPAGSEYKPVQTRAWLMMDFTVTNVSGQQSMFSTTGAFDLRDNTNTSHLVSIVSSDTLPKGKQFQDHEVPPGGTATGEVVFDVPANGAPFLLKYSGNMWHASEHPPMISLSDK